MTNTRKLVVGFGVLALFGFNWFMNTTIPTSPPKAEKVTAQAEPKREKPREKTVTETIDDTETECGDSARCWAKKFETWPSGYGAAGKCTSAIQEQALYDFRWTWGSFSSGDTLFNGYEFAPRRKPVISYLGEAVEFQNSAGNWMRQHYVCFFDPRDKTAKAIVGPGRWIR